MDKRVHPKITPFVDDGQNPPQVKQAKPRKQKITPFVDEDV